jgi:hypothetical protein
MSQNHNCKNYSPQALLIYLQHPVNISLGIKGPCLTSFNSVSELLAQFQGSS